MTSKKNTLSWSFSRSYRGPLQAVVLDWAGTTVDYGCLSPTAVFLEVFRKRGVEITLEEARGPMGAHKKDHIRALSRMESVASRWRAAHGKPCTEEDVDAMFREFVPMQVACLADYAALIPGTLEAVQDFRRRGLRIGTSTGYTSEMMEVLVPEARMRGYEPDFIACASDVPCGRPAPWMFYKNAMALGVYPMESLVKIGDTVADVEEGLNAGAWTIGVTKSGNEVGLTEKEVAALSPAELRTRLERAEAKLYKSGAHFVVEGIWAVGPVLDEISARLKHGERP
ncbi:MAG: phosphonoacetaldehyde hydrolase [Deltaproteobacteria bacterium]|nr:phosphonoacetaldehyde hydrolase [Deltaproteobacteria bacterium]